VDMSIVDPSETDELELLAPVSSVTGLMLLPLELVSSVKALGLLPAELLAPVPSVTALELDSTEELVDSSIVDAPVVLV